MADKNEWYTPKKYINSAKIVLGSIDLDPFSCAKANATVQAFEYYTKHTDYAHTRPWQVNTVFINPPYSNGLYKPSIERFLNQFQKYRFKAITLTNNNTDTEATSRLINSSSAICLPDHRIAFVNELGDTVKGNMRGQVFCYFGERMHAFKHEFTQYGNVLFNKF